MATIGTLAAEDVADYIDYTKKVLAQARDHDAEDDSWIVIELSPRKAALVRGESTALVPSHETVLAKKDMYEVAKFY